MKHCFVLLKVTNRLTDRRVLVVHRYYIALVVDRYSHILGPPEPSITVALLDLVTLWKQFLCMTVKDLFDQFILGFSSSELFLFALHIFHLKIKGSLMLENKKWPRDLIDFK